MRVTLPNVSEQQFKKTFRLTPNRCLTLLLLERFFVVGVMFCKKKRGCHGCWHKRMHVGFKTVGIWLARKSSLNALWSLASRGGGILSMWPMVALSTKLHQCLAHFKVFALSGGNARAWDDKYHPVALPLPGPFLGRNIIGPQFKRCSSSSSKIVPFPLWTSSSSPTRQ